HEFQKRYPYGINRFVLGYVPVRQIDRVFVFLCPRATGCSRLIELPVGLLHQRRLSRRDLLAPAVGTLRVPGGERRVGVTRSTNSTAMSRQPRSQNGRAPRSRAGLERRATAVLQSIFSKKITDLRRRRGIRGCIALLMRPTWPQAAAGAEPASAAKSQRR